MDGINLRNVEPFANNPRGNFDLSHTVAFDFKFGDLVPALIMPIIPGDEVSLGHESLDRFAPFISQIYQTYKEGISYFYVPNRVLWDDFDNFQSGGYDGNTEYIEPYFDMERMRQLVSVTNTKNTLFDFFNIPHSAIIHSTADDLKIRALPFYAYAKIILDYYLGVGTSLNKIVEVTANRGLCHQGDNTLDFLVLYESLLSGNPQYYLDDNIPIGATFDSVFQLIQRLYPLDYFTMARPNPQLGPVMTIPLQLINTDVDGKQTFKMLGQNPQTSGSTTLNVIYQNGSNSIELRTQTGSKNVVVNGSVFNNVATINDFYSAARIQQLLTIYGYTGFTPAERIAAEYRVKNGDLRLHRSQFLHYIPNDIQVGEVFSNNVNLAGNTPTPELTDADIPGAGTAVAKHTSYTPARRYKFTEFGWLIGLKSTFPEAAYHQGVPRYMMAGDRFDYPHPLLSQLGMQDIKNGEIMWDYGSVAPTETFAYNPRYSEYKVMTNRIHGELASSLAYLSNSRFFSQSPRFNDQFLRVDPHYNRLNRSFNTVSDNNHDQPLFSKIKFNIFVNRCLPYYGLPKF